MSISEGHLTSAELPFSDHRPGRQAATEILVKASARVWNTVLMLGALASLAGCAGRIAADPVPTVRCEAGDTVRVLDLLYFGRNRPDGGTVSDAEWETFMAEVVTPRFPAGLTVFEATGQWRGESGIVEREGTKVLSLLHSGDAPARRAVVEIIEEY